MNGHYCFDLGDSHVDGFMMHRQTVENMETMEQRDDCQEMYCSLHSRLRLFSTVTTCQTKTAD